MEGDLSAGVQRELVLSRRESPQHLEEGEFLLIVLDAERRVDFAKDNG